MAFGIDDAIAAVANLAKDGIDKIWPNPTEEAAAKVALIKAQVEATVSQLQAAQQVMLAEESSADPWTSRARPTFLYVIYFLILASVPMAITYAVKPDLAHALIDGFHQWLAAIPDSYLQLFGVGYLGYTGGRSLEKWKGVTK